MRKIGHLNQISLYSQDSIYRKVIEGLMSKRPEIRRVLADEAVLNQVKEFDLNQLENHNGFVENTAETLEQLALLDTLTEAYNGRAFLQELDQELKHAWRGNGTTSLCMVSVDDFDKITKQYHLLTANSILRICAEAIRKIIKPTDVLARYNNADFGVIMPDTSTASAAIVAEKIRQAISTQNITCNHNVIKVTASLGIATYPLHAFERDELISIAIQSLYVSKNRGGDRVCTI